jgi:NAD(P)-dependent dehydrogenase (short-subunit alcohol dehydrogenase family)
MSGRLQDRVAVITGGASGIGREIARRYVEEGAQVVLGDRNMALLSEAEKELGAACAVCAGDVRVETDVERLLERASEAFGRVDVGVNCAGLGTLAPIVDQTEEQWSEVIDVCLKGVFLSMKHEARQMIAAGRGGVIINIASINARQPSEGMSAYCSAKAAVEMLTRCAAMELAGDRIRVVGIGPGFVDTPLTSYAKQFPAIREAYLKTIPLGRVGTPRDIANAALFLASDEASWVTGETLFVDGAELTKAYPELLRLAAAALRPEGS